MKKKCVLVRHYMPKSTKEHELWPGMIFFFNPEELSEASPDCPLYGEDCTKPFMTVPKAILYHLDQERDQTEIYFVERVRTRNTFSLRGVISKNGNDVTLRDFQKDIRQVEDPIENVQEYAYIFFPAAEMYSPVPAEGLGIK